MHPLAVQEGSHHQLCSLAPPNSLLLPVHVYVRFSYSLVYHIVSASVCVTWPTSANNETLHTTTHHTQVLYTLGTLFQLTGKGHKHISRCYRSKWSYSTYAVWEHCFLPTDRATESVKHWKGHLRILHVKFQLHLLTCSCSGINASL